MSKAVVKFVKQGTDVKGVAPCDFSGKLGELTATTLSKKARTVFVGLGKDPKLHHLRQAVHTAGTHLKKTKTTSATVQIPSYLPSVEGSTFPLDKSVKPLPTSRAVSEWMTKSVYEFEANKSTKRSKPIDLDFNSASRADVKAGKIVGQAVNFARTLGNLRPDVCDPDYMARQAIKLCSSGGFKLRHNLDHRDLVKKGLLLHHAVGKGSERKPRLVVLEYIGDPKSDTTTALVGKGITMDTGGLNVKPFGSMETMHMDMMGAAAVLGAAKAVSDLRLPVNVVVAVALAENAIGYHSYMPSTVIKSLKGTTVEITNTDAEGRLVLADAFTFVQDHAKVRKVTRMIDLATLTGACMAALGEERAGLFTNSPTLGQDLCTAGEETLERVWPLPIDSDHEEKMKGKLSDLINCTTNRYAGACTAAAFLKHFVNKDVQWAHLDIAGPGMGTVATKTNPAGAPGYGVSLLVRYLEKQARR